MDLITLALTAVLAIILIPLLKDTISSIVQKIQQRRRIVACIEKLPGEKWYPIIGTTLPFLRAGRQNFWKAFTERNKTYAPLFKSWMGFYPGVHIMKPEHVEIILSSNENITKGPNYRFVIPWLGQGLITSSGKRWQAHRKFLTPTFHFSILDSFQDVFNEKSQSLVEFLAKKADGNYFDVIPHLAHCALDVICETAMGTKINALENSDSEYVKAVYGMAELAVARMFNGLLHSNFIFKFSKMGKQQEELLSILHGFTRKVIQEKREKYQSGGRELKRQLTEEEKQMGKKERKAFLDLLLEDEKIQLSDEEIREEVDTFMFAGHDTTTISTTWTLFALANHPDIQEKVHQELDEIFHGEERPITPEDLLEMKYLERVLKEVLRLHNIVPAIARTLDKDIVLDGHTIPAGVMLVLHLYELHRDPQQYPDPERFDPDRFLPERAAQRHPFAYVPFSAGPRNCLGQKFASRNSRTIIASILRRFKVKSQNTPENTDVYAEIVMRPQNGLFIALEDRKLSK